VGEAREMSLTGAGFAVKEMGSGRGTGFIGRGPDLKIINDAVVLAPARLARGLHEALPHFFFFSFPSPYLFSKIQYPVCRTLSYSTRRPSATVPRVDRTFPSRALPGHFPEWDKRTDKFGGRTIIIFCLIFLFFLLR
jgi:hypothetical protein